MARPVIMKAVGLQGTRTLGGRVFIVWPTPRSAMTFSERCQVIVRLKPPSWRAVRRSARRRAWFILRKRLCHALASAYGDETFRA